MAGRHRAARPQRRIAARSLAVGSIAATSWAALMPGMADAQVAQSTSLAPSDTGWYWQSLGEPSLVPTGDLPVAVTNGVTKTSAVRYELAALGSVSAITKASLELQLDPKATQLNSLGAPIELCPVTSIFIPGPAQSADNKPAADCAHPAAGVLNAAKTAYDFDVSSTVASWLHGSAFGFAVLPQESLLPFQVSFLGAPKLSVSYLPALAAAANHPAIAESAPVTAAVAGVPAVASTSIAPSVAEPAVSASQDAAPQVAASQDAASQDGAPQDAALPALAPQHVSRSSLDASIYRPEGSDLPGSPFWLAGLGGVAALALASWSMGEHRARPWRRRTV